MILGLLLALVRIDVAAGDFLFAPSDIPHAYVVRSERARMLSTISPAGIEQLFVSLSTPVVGAEPPTDVLMPPMPEIARLIPQPTAPRSSARLPRSPTSRSTRRLTFPTRDLIHLAGQPLAYAAARNPLVTYERPG